MYLQVIESDEEDTPQQTEETPAEVTTGEPEEHEPPPLQQAPLEQQFDLEADISQLEAPTFTTINRGPPEPMLRLRWDHRVNLIGEKVLNPMIHCCDKCLKPILIYGRMVRYDNVIYIIYEEYVYIYIIHYIYIYNKRQKTLCNYYIIVDTL